MSVHQIYYQNGAKFMRPISSEEELRQLRNSERQQSLVAQARGLDSTGSPTEAKRKLLQFNYSCLPNEDGSLKGSTRLSGSVGMDIDFNEDDNQAENLSNEIRDRILSMKDELGLLFFERSATKGYHIAFKRHAELSQELNLQWASHLLGVKYDEGAKDHTRVFFSSTASEDDLLFVSPELFDNETVFPVYRPSGDEQPQDAGFGVGTNLGVYSQGSSNSNSETGNSQSSTEGGFSGFCQDYDGIPTWCLSKR